MKKILVLASTFPLSDDDPTPSFVRDQIVELKKKYSNLEFIVLAPSYQNKKSSKSSYYKENRFRYFFSKFEKLAGSGILPALKKNYLYILIVPFFLMSQLIATIKIAFRAKPDLIYAHWVMPQGLIALLCFKVTKIPFVFTNHAYDAEILTKLPFVGKLLLNSIVKNSKSFTFDSKNTEYKLKRVIKENNWKQEKSKIIPMGVNNNKFESTESTKISEIDNDLDKFKVVFAGRFAEKKGVESLIKAFTKLPEIHDEVVIFICGTGTLINDYLNLIDKYNLSKNIKILEFFNDTGKLKYIYEIADLIVIPSIVTKDGDVEGLPVVLMEAIYFGNATLSSIQSNAGDIIINGKNGFLFDSDTNHELSKRIQDIFERKETLTKIKKEALKTSNNYLIEAVNFKFYEHLFKNI